MSRARAAKALIGLLCALPLVELTFGVSPASRASAVEPGDPTAQDGFGAGVVAWTATDMGGARWVTATDTSNPSPEKKVLTNTDSQTGIHAAHWTGVALGGPFRAEAKIKGPVGGTDNWVGIAFRYNPATGAYLVARYRA
ncbi:MAG: hypothetical protein K8I02_04795, partial [Candidatus Methylomirabilis sp.]|nr:hypothetical protein [Deltaproteobacteria bacterium]